MGNNKIYSNRYPLCQCNWCNNNVSAITKNSFIFSVSYCEEHCQGIKIKCNICNKEYISKPGDVINQIADKKQIKCRKCAVTELNKTEVMRKQAGELGKITGLQNLIKGNAWEKSHTPESEIQREISKRNNGFYNEGGGLSKGLTLRKENGSLEKWKNSGQTSEAHSRQNVTRWNNMSEKEKIEKLKKLGKSPSFKAVENVKYYFDKSIKDYIPWEEFKIKFNRMRLTKDISIFINKLRTLEIMKNVDIELIPTFRDQDSDTWIGKRNAFEQSVVDMNINWFTYIKFYIDSKNIVRPLVVGEAGSMTVNSSGSDVSFSYDEDHGPSRVFLSEINASWDKTQILIIKAKSKKQALFFEFNIAKIFNLFES